MKTIFIYFLVGFYILLTNSIYAQDQFPSVGSYWLYSHEPHDGNGFGWDKIKVTNDTLIDDTWYKVLQHTFYRQQTLPPLITYEGEGTFGLMNVRNDSVFVNDKLIFDYSAQAGDTLSVFAGYDFSVQIELVIDSIGLEPVNMGDSKIFYGNKFCPINGQEEPYQEFVAIEKIGPIGVDFFTWNSDGCILGGGTATFDCFREPGIQRYPESADCIEPFLSALQTSHLEKLKLYPNPVNDRLVISNDSEIDSYEIYGIGGKLILSRNELNSISFNINTTLLDNGLYFIKVTAGGREQTLKFVKN